jgi:peptidyl-prolyl cis-trans isomerase C
MTDPKGAVARVLRQPALHFLVLGGLLVAANGWWQDWRGDELSASIRDPLIISDGQVRQIRRDLRIELARVPSDQEIQAAIQTAIDDEVLYRAALASGLDRDNRSIRERLIKIARFVAEDPNQDDEALYQLALRLGLDKSDPVIRRQLSTMMRLVAADTPMAGEEPPSEKDLETYLRQHPDSFVESWRGDFTQIFFSQDRRGAAAKDDARKALDTLRAKGIGPAQARRLGDPFLLGRSFRWQSEPTLRGHFGPAFTQSLATLQPGAWSDPIRSTYGWHLVWLYDVRPATVPPLDQVRDRVREAVLNDRRDRRLETTLQTLRAAYAIQVDTPKSDRVATKERNGNG